MIRVIKQAAETLECAELPTSSHKAMRGWSQRRPLSLIFVHVPTDRCCSLDEAAKIPLALQIVIKKEKKSQDRWRDLAFSFIS